MKSSPPSGRPNPRPERPAPPRSYYHPMKLQALVALVALAAGCSTPAAAQAFPYANETKEQHDERMAWWREAKFGMFIHWGVYAVPAGTYKGRKIGFYGEWIMNSAQIPCSEYQAFAKQFNPVKYQPAEWARLAKAAGMRYLVITSKHHEGFALFPTAASKWNVVDASPYGRDLIGPLAEAVRAEGLKFGLYYSQAQDWVNPGGAKPGKGDGAGWDPAHKGSFDKYLDEVSIPQVREILTRYQPDVLWWDTPYLMTKPRADKLAALLALKPGIIHNNRLGVYPGDTETPEQRIPATGYPGRDWETCMTMNGTWGYKSYDHNWKPTKVLLRNLCDIVSKGGNYLLNIGPTAEGEIPPESIQRLQEVGAWMKKNGESIYGTTASPFRKLAWGRCTTKAGATTTTLYLHVFDWPADGKLVVPGLRNKVVSAALLDGGSKLEVEAGEQGPTVKVPAAAPDPIVSVIALGIEGKPEVEEVAQVPAADGSFVLAAAEATTTGGMKYESDKDCLGFWTNAAATATWTIKVPAEGDYTVSGETACPAASGLKISCGASSVTAKVGSTGAYQTFAPLAFDGRLRLAAGRQSITLASGTRSWQPVNVRRITLRPAD